MAEVGTDGGGGGVDPILQLATAWKTLSLSALSSLSPTGPALRMWLMVNLQSQVLCSDILWLLSGFFSSSVLLL